MNVIGYAISLAVTGLIVGGLARLVLPGKQQLSIMATIGFGLAGSFIGGTVAALILRRSSVLGLILSIAAAVGLLVLGDRKGWVRTVR